MSKLSKKSGRSVKSKNSVKLEVHKKLLETNKNANNELREEIRRLNQRLARQEEFQVKYKQLKIGYNQLLNKLEKSEMQRRD